MGQNTQLAIASNTSIDRIVFDEVKIATITNQICKGGTKAEIEIFIATCEQRGLNPFAKQIYFMKYGTSPAAHVVSIDGLRLIADRTGRYAPGQKASFIYDNEGALLSATAYVKKRVGAEWIEAEEEAYYEEYVQKSNGKPREKWATMPRVMLSKCAEARALRRAFPEELSGLYAQEEMDQAGNIYEAQALDSSAVPEPPSGRQKVAASPIPALDPTPVDLTFKKGDNAGKRPDECSDEFLQSSVERWDSGVKCRPEMRAEVERVLAERRDEAMQEAEEMAFKEADKQAIAGDEPIEAVVVEPEPETEPGAETATVEVPTVETLPAATPTPKKMSNAVKTLILTAQKAGLSMAPDFRAERLQVVNNFLKAHGHDAITSFNDLNVPLAFKIQTEIEMKLLAWGETESAETTSAAAESEDSE